MPTTLRWSATGDKVSLVSAATIKNAKPSSKRGGLRWMAPWHRIVSGKMPCACLTNISTLHASFTTLFAVLGGLGEVDSTPRADYTCTWGLEM